VTAPFTSNFASALTARLGLEVPIVQGPMAGGTSTPELAAAVCQAGGLGFLAGAYLSPAQIAEQAARIRALAPGRPFGINLFAPVPTERCGAPPADPAAALAVVAAAHARLGLPPPELPAPQPEPFDAQWPQALDCAPAVLSLTFGLPTPALLQAAHARGIEVWATVNTVAEARAAAAAGCDALVAQGSEAGGHRAAFLSDFERAQVGTLALVPQCVDAVAPLPVVASGGIADGRGLAAALLLGAQAVQIGTAFAVADEAGSPGAYRAALARAQAEDTRLTRAFSGRPARGIANAFMAAAEPHDRMAMDASSAVLPYPLQNALTRPLRQAAARSGDAGHLSLWCGQAAPLAQPAPAAAIVERLMREAQAARARI
jgi:nitronate monooxygenase